MQKLRVGLIGLGYRGQYLYKLLTKVEGFELIALADPKIKTEDYPKTLHIYEDYLQMLQKESLDLVFISTPWHLQEEIALQSLQADCHIAIEIKGGLRLNEYDKIKKVSYQKDKKVFPLENTLFMQDVLAVREMVQAGLFGELIQLSGAYRHDLRAMLSTNDEEASAYWRRHYYETINGDLYPTHSFAPLCLISGNKAQDFQTLTSFASSSKGWQTYMTNEHKQIKTGDIIISHLRDKNDCLFTFTHDTSLPRPKSLEYEVQGTKAIWQAEHKRIYIEGVSPKETWEDIAPYLQQYKHKYWQLWEQEALEIDEHHQGMDYIMLKAILSDLDEDIPYPATIDDLSLWCSITPLSAESIAREKSINLSER